ncbi:c-type cytochrome [Methylotenera versatilis]|uniref:c-type cytochrome n=1 Tax=Methylotenera versatilis TaxID=1055487 RepID=UPI0006460FAD|nr:c-type cytochrome [Methylotenera versatilis]
MRNQSVLTFILAASLGFTAQSALADGAILAEKANCLTCHTVEKRNVGPAFKEVAAVYKGQDVEDKLINKIKKGGRGNWGILPMPPNEGKLTDDEFREVVRWIRSL